jgi:hypothetical protein
VLIARSASISFGLQLRMLVMEKPSSGGVESARLAAALVWNAVASFPSVQGATMAVAIAALKRFGCS